MDLATFKKGIFNLPFRRFGSVSQIMVRRLYGFGPPKNNFHDLYDYERDERVEVKFSVVRSSWNETITEANIMQCIANCCVEANRVVPFKSWRSHRFDCSMNHVKPAEFEKLYYGLFFEDGILIFKIRSGEIGPEIAYSDKQQKGNVEEGQFHINNKTLPIHVRKFFQKALGYPQLMELFQKEMKTPAAP